MKIKITCLSKATRRVKMQSHKLSDYILICESNQITGLCNKMLSINKSDGPSKKGENA